MKAITVNLHGSTLRMLNQVAPPEQRKRAEFVRNAVRKAIREEMKERTRAGYERFPDTGDVADDWSSAEPWEP